MSHSTAAVKFISDDLILYGEYNGTVDVMLPKLYETQEERDDNWRTQDWPLHDMSCDKAEDVIVAVIYGGGWSWKSKACRHCKLLTDNWNPYEDDIIRTDGIPDWYPNRDDYYDLHKE